MNYDIMLDHAMGGIFGQAIGDAFGIPALLRPELTEKQFGWITSFLEPTPDHPAHGGMPRARITDDTEQALVLAEIFLRDNKVSVEGTVEGILKWYDMIDGDNSPYVGPSTRKAVLGLKQGKDPYTTGDTGDTNGSAMRISPVGIMNAGDIHQACEDAYLTCVPSHHTYSAVSATCAVSGAIAKAMIPGSSLEDIIETGITCAEENRWRGMSWFASNVARRIAFGVELASDKNKSVKERLLDIYDFIGGGFLASEAIPSAFALFYMAEGDVMLTAELSANMSGDADTIGAIACAMAGAYSGFSSIPSSSVALVEEVNETWKFREIATDLALYAMKRGSNA
ncbi:MAG: ADP-ribosylglycohydrolase family protein [Sphaerochaetaceae bacterium]